VLRIPEVQIVAVKLRPLADRVVIKPLEREEMTKSGIVLPDTVKEKPQEGLIEAVGNGRFNEQTGSRIALDVKVGDRVMYAKYAGSEIKIDEVDYLILSEKDILAVVVKNGKS
jgi:chaperonin GroES